MRAYFDTSVLVASCVSSHSHFIPADLAVKTVQRKQMEGCVSAHGLAEFYGVITRLPFTPRVLPHQAFQLLTEEILAHFHVIALTGDEYQEAVRRASQSGWGGGRIYDLLHIVSAQRANCDQIYTFNVRHFQQLAPELGNLISAP